MYFVANKNDGSADESVPVILMSYQSAEEFPFPYLRGDIFSSPLLLLLLRVSGRLRVRSGGSILSSILSGVGGEVSDAAGDE